MRSRLLCAIVLCASALGALDASASDLKGQTVAVSGESFKKLGVYTFASGFHFAGTDYSFRLMAEGAIQAGRHALPAARMVWLVQELGGVPCAGYGMCRQERIVDVMKLPGYSPEESLLFKPSWNDAPHVCTWRNEGVLALVGMPSPEATPSITGAWWFDLQHERIVAVTPRDVTCVNVREAFEEARANRFLAEGFDIDESAGLQGLHRLGRVIDEEIKSYSYPNPYQPKETVEVRRIQYEGLQITAHFATFSVGDQRVRKMIIEHVLITSPRWPMKYGLGVGSSAEQLKELFGDRFRREGEKLIYGFRSSTVTFAVKGDAIVSVDWRYGVD